ncbi:MAG: hypothetical protein PHN72_01455 [Bacilli bacterium]|nr:hypothetical protein [Bacilli bacterium]
MKKIKFTPLIDEPILSFLKDKNQVKKLTSMFGSPCNVLFPQRLQENINIFYNIFDKHLIDGKVFYAHKANQSTAIVKEAALTKASIDVASLNELKSAVSSGFVGDKIEATGPKNIHFLILGLQHHITFNIDSISELEQLLILKEKLKIKQKIKIICRISGFRYNDMLSKKSRFGIDIEEMDTCFCMIKENLQKIDFLGFSFHLDTIMKQEKVNAICTCIELFLTAYKYGLTPHILDIGGGYKVNYLKDKEEWDESITALKLSLFSQESFTWNDASFGLTVKNHTLSGTLNIYNYYDEETADKYLNAILESKLEQYQNQTIGEILSENMITLYIEPGKSLLNQMGITLANVTFIKKSNQEILIGLDMKKSDVVIGEQELFMDPIILSDAEKLQKEVGVYFVGNLCLENDLIFKHKVFIDRIPKIGDVIAFMNTAGYFMDFNASSTIKQNIAKKVIAIKKEKGFDYYEDEIYHPLVDKE